MRGRAGERVAYVLALALVCALELCACAGRRSPCPTTPRFGAETTSSRTDGCRVPQ